MASFYVEAMVKGYHVYQDIWTTVVGEKLFPCKREAGNAFDPFAVAVMRGTTVLSSVISREGSHPFAPSFLRKEGSITCQVTGQTDRTHIEGQRSRVILFFECSNFRMHSGHTRICTIPLYGTFNVNGTPIT